MEKFKGTNFKGKVVTCHKDFVPFLVLLNDKLAELGLNIFITSSLRNSTNVKGASVTPAKMSNHLVGHAIDFNLIDGSEWWNSKRLANPTGKVKEFIDYIDEIGLRWGGFFRKPDVIHIDYAINLKHPDKYKRILEQTIK